MILKFTPNHFEEVIKKGYSMDQLILMGWIHEQVDLTTLISGSAKVSALYQSLIRKALITEDGSKLTTLGQELLIFINTKDAGKIIKKKTDTTDFDLWWKTFPSTDTFEYKGKVFSGCRSLRQNKEECRLKFNKIVIEGEYSISTLITALEFDVISKKESSIKTGTNKLTYLQNSLTYLNQRSYEGFIELLQQENISTSNISTRNGTDI